MCFSFLTHHRGADANRAKANSAPKMPRPTRRPTFQPPSPRLECLEERDVPAVFTVLHTADTLEPGSLRWAIGEANDSPGTALIRFAPRAFGTIELNPALGELQITDGLFIDGPGANRLTVSGGGDTRVFSVLPAEFSEPPTKPELDSAPAVFIRGLTITQGKGTDAPGYLAGNGGGLYNLGGSVFLDRVDMVNNRAEGAFAGIGGAVSNISGNLTVTRSSFADNTAEGDLNALAGALNSDAAFVSDDSALEDRLPTTFIDRSSFVGNTARSLVGIIPDTGNFGTFGGAIYSSGPLTISRTEFIGNSAESGPGAEGVTIGGEAYAGAVFFTTLGIVGEADADFSLRNSTFVGNISRGGDGVLDGIPGGNAQAGAVGIYDLNAALNATLAGNMFLDNAAIGGRGGAGAAGGLARAGGVGGFGTVDLALMHNTYVGNLAQGGEGGRDARGGDGRGGGLFLDSYVFFGAFTSGPPTASVSSDLFFNNTAAGGHGSTGGDGLGGGIFNNGAANMDRLLAAGNRAHGGDGAVSGHGRGGGLFNGSSGDAIVTRSTVVSNRTHGGDGADGLGEGGGIYSEAGGNLRLDRWTIQSTVFNEASDDEDDIFGTYLLV